MTRIGVPEGRGRFTAAVAISSTLKIGASAPAATAPAVIVRNLRLVTVSMVAPMHSLHTQGYRVQALQTLAELILNYEAPSVCGRSIQQHPTNQRSA